MKLHLTAKVNKTADTLRDLLWQLRDLEKLIKEFHLRLDKIQKKLNLPNYNSVEVNELISSLKQDMKSVIDELE